MTMSKRRYVGVAGLVLAAVSCVSNNAETGSDEIAAQSDSLLHRSSKVPSELAVPEGQRLAFRLAARGDQIYGCQAGEAGTNAWLLIEPDATLYGLFGWYAGHHYAGPTWEARDGSVVKGKRLAGASVDATAIPWLLLEASEHSGRGWMTRVSYIQRLDTHGGVAPAGSCELGAKVEVAYTATYAFYVPTRGK